LELEIFRKSEKLYEEAGQLLHGELKSTL